MTDAVQKTRLAKAVAILIAIVLCIPAADALYGQRASVLPDDSRAGLDAQRIIGDADAVGFVERMEEAASARDAQPSPAFQKEIGLPAPCRDVRADSTGTIVSCIVDGEPEAVFESVASHMAERGWRSIALGSVEGATFVKEEGQCTWTLVTCTQVGNSTNIVFRCLS